VFVLVNSLRGRLDTLDSQVSPERVGEVGRVVAAGGPGVVLAGPDARSPPQQARFCLMAGTRAVHRDADDDQGDAGQATYGTGLAQDDQSGSGGGGGQLMRLAAGWRPSPDARSQPARTEEFGYARNDDAQHPEPDVVTCPPAATLAAVTTRNQSSR
jgi:hypothetical protein